MPARISGLDFATESGVPTSRAVVPRDKSPAVTVSCHDVLLLMLTDTIVILRDLAVSLHLRRREEEKGRTGEVHFRVFVEV